MEVRWSWDEGTVMAAVVEVRWSWDEGTVMAVRSTVHGESALELG